MKLHMRNNLLGAAFATLTVLYSAAPSFAGTCLEGVGTASQSLMDSFRAQPASLLQGNPTTSNIADQVRVLVATETDLTASMLTLAAADSTNAAQKAAIGSGLARAANVCRQQHPDLADAITQSIAEAVVSNPALASFQTAFLQALSGQTATAALGGAPGAGPAAGAGDIGNAAAAGATGGTVTAAAGGTPNDAGSLTSNGSGGTRTTDGGGGNSTTTIIESVSPSIQ